MEILQQLKTLIISLQPQSQFDMIDSFDSAVDVLLGIIQQNPTSVINSYQQIELIFGEVMSQCTAQECAYFLQFIINLVSNYPTTFKKYPDKSIKIIKAIIKTMVGGVQEPTQAWKNPPDGFNQDNQQEEDVITVVRGHFDVFAQAIGYINTINLFLPIAQELFNLNDWKTDYALLMIMSQLGQNNDDVYSVSEFVSVALIKIKHNNPKVRYASLHMFGQLSDDMKPIFQQKYTQSSLPSIIQALDDSIPRVVSHSLACLTNFLQDYDDVPRIAQYTTKIITHIYYFIENQGISSNIKQNCLSALSSLATIPHFFQPPTVQLVLKIVNAVLQKYGTSELYKQLRGQALESLSITFSIQHEKYLQPYLQSALSIMVNSTNKQLFAQSYILTSWTRFLRSFKAPIALNIIYYPIFNVVKSFAQSNDSQANVAIQVLIDMVQSYGYQFRPCVNQCYNLIKQLYSKSQNLQFRTSCTKFITQMVSSLTSQAPDPLWHDSIRQMLHFFFQKIELCLNNQELDYFEELQNLFKSMQNLIKNMNLVLTQQQLTILCNRVIQLIPIIDQKIKQLKILLQQNKNQNKKSQSWIKDLQQKVHQAYQSKLIIPDIFQAFFKISSKQKTNQILIKILPYIQNTVNQNQNKQQIRYGLYYLDNILQVCNYQVLANCWLGFNNKLMQFSLNSDALVRNSAVFGLGLLIMKTPVELVMQDHLNQWINILKKSFEIPIGSQTKKQYNFAKDNVISALGRLLKIFGKPFNLSNLYKQWLSSLPLNNDKIQGNIQQQFLIDLIKNDPGIIIDSKEMLLVILEIYAKFLKKRSLSKKNFKQILIKTKQSLMLIKQWPLFKQNIQFLWNNLQQNDKYQLTKLCQ